MDGQVNEGDMDRFRRSFIERRDGLGMRESSSVHGNVWDVFLGYIHEQNSFFMFVLLRA